MKESCEDWHCFDLFLLPRSMGRDSNTHNQQFLISSIQKIGILQVVVSEEDTVIRMTNLPIHSLACLVPITSIFYQHHQKTSHTTILHRTHPVLKQFLPVSLWLSSIWCQIFKDIFFCFNLLNQQTSL